MIEQSSHTTTTTTNATVSEEQDIDIPMRKIHPEKPTAVENSQSNDTAEISKESGDESLDEIDCFRVQLEDDEDRCDIAGVEMLMEGTEERNANETAMLEEGKARFEKGMNYWTECDLEQAMVEFSTSLQLREDICGRKDSETAKCYLWVGTIHFLQAEYELALDQFYRCYRIQNELCGNQNQEEGHHMVINWINKSLTCLGMKKKEERNVEWKKFLKSLEQEQTGDAHAMDAASYETTSIPAYRTSMRYEYLRRRMNPSSPSRALSDCGDLWYKMGRTYQVHGNLSRAMMEYREAFGIYRAAFGPNHRHTILTMDRMVELLTDMGFVESMAAEYVDRIHESMAYEKAGDALLETTKNPEAALKQYELALSIEDCSISKSLAASAILHYKLARALVLLKETIPALMHACRAVGMLEHVLGGSHKHTISSLKLVKALSQQSPPAPATPRTPRTPMEGQQNAQE